MKCKCGNEMGKPRVSPYPVTIIDFKTREEIKLMFMAGFVNEKDCYFCAVKVRGTG